MKRILIIYECDNGYNCGCCRRDWEDTETYEVDDEINLKEFCNKKAKEAFEDYKNREDYGRYAIKDAYVITESLH